MKKDNQSYTKFCIKLNDINDADIIETLWSVDNKTEYIRTLIRGEHSNINFSTYSRLIKEHLIKRMLETAYNNCDLEMKYDEVIIDILDHRLDTWLKEVCIDTGT